MVRKFKQIVKQAQTEATYWKYAAWTAPFVALTILILELWLGEPEFIQKTIKFITITFITVSVFWWWWAIHKIIVILESMERTSDNFEDVKKELRETRKSFTRTFGDD